jgi:hypothetical protein
MFEAQAQNDIQLKLLNICESPNDRLLGLLARLRGNQTYIDLTGFFRLTKTEQGWVDAVAIRDFAVEKNVARWISERSSTDAIMDRYQSYDPELHSRKAPQHYALKILSGIGSVSSGKNIFMFFPEALELEAKSEEEVFGLEFIDVWSNIFSQSIFECVKRSFTPESQVKLLVALESNLAEAIFLSSIFHEIGHRVGPYRVSPNVPSDMNLSPFQRDVFGELATDSLLILNLKEFPEVAAFVILQRLFWFTRRGFADNPLSATINSDNDSWIGAYLWNKLTNSGVVSPTQRGLNYHPENIVPCFSEIISEIDRLAHFHRGHALQRERINQWMSNQVPFSQGRFFLPPNLKSIYEVCHDIPELPHFRPAFPYSQISKLREQHT